MGRDDQCLCAAYVLLLITNCCICVFYKIQIEESDVIHNHLPIVRTTVSHRIKGGWLKWKCWEYYLITEYP